MCVYVCMYVYIYIYIYICMLRNPISSGFYIIRHSVPAIPPLESQSWATGLSDPIVPWAGALALSFRIGPFFVRDNGPH